MRVAPSADERDPLDDYRTIRGELEKFDAELAKRPELVVLSKADLPDVGERSQELTARFADAGIELLHMSAWDKKGVRDILLRLEQLRSEPLS